MADDPGRAHEAGPRRGMGKPCSKTKRIDVYVDRIGQTGNEIECDILPDSNAAKQYVRQNQVSLPQGEGPFEICFRLADSLDWDPNKPIATSRNGCPPGNNHNDNEQIFFQPPDGKYLTIIDLNAGNGCKLSYRLNFTDGTYCDPIIDNGGNS